MSLEREKAGGLGDGTMMGHERLREMQMSIAETSVFPGFRFSPTDQELISYYLKKKLEGSDGCVDIIHVVDFCRHEPWDLPANSIFQSDNEWFFFSARGRKYANGSQSRRATDSGYWKATGKERKVKSGSRVIGAKRTLVFHTGRAPKGERTEWIMHEYCMDGTSQDSLVVCRLRRNSNFRLNETPRRHSQDRRNLSAGDNSNFALFEDGIPLVGILDGTKAVDSCAKESTSNYNSHSIEQNDSGSESDPKLMNLSSPHGSSGLQKDCDEDCDDVDDCFADIMKDDIIKLDESSLSTSQVLEPLIVRETEARVKSKQSVQRTMSDALPFQGTANRRIRLRKHKVKIQHIKPLEASGGGNENRGAEEVGVLQSHQSPSCVISMLINKVDVVVQRRSVSLILVILTLLVLFVSWLGGSWQVKKFSLASLF